MEQPTLVTRRVCVLVLGAVVGAVVVLGGSASCGAAQPSGGPVDASPAAATPEARTAAARAALTEALNQSVREGKLLVVTYSNSEPNKRENQRSLAAPVTRAFLERHAVVFDVTDAGLIRQLTGVKTGGLVDTPGGDPLVFRAGKRLALNLASEDVRNPSAKNAQGSIALAMRLDWSVRRPSSGAEHAGFIERYDRRDAEAPARARALHATDGQGVAAFEPDAGVLKNSGVLGVLAVARERVRAGTLAEAAGVYCWLWERGLEADASIDAALVSVVAAEMHLLAGASAPAKARFTALRDEAGAVLRTRDGVALHRYLVLCRVIGDEAFSLTFLDEAVNAPVAVRSIPTPDRLIAQMLLPSCHFNDPVKGVADPGALVARLAQRVVNAESATPDEPGAEPEPGPAGPQGRPDPTTPAERAARAQARVKALAPAAAYARWLGDIELARRYAYALREGPEAGQMVLDRAGVQITPARRAMIKAMCQALGVQAP